MLTNGKSYLEFRPILQEELTLAFTDVSTAYNFFVLKPSPLVHSVQVLNFSFRLNKEDIWDMETSKSQGVLCIRRWRKTFDALASLQDLRKVYLWLDANTEFPLQELFYNMEIYRFRESVASILILNCPASETSDLSLLATFKPHLHHFRLHRRGYPKYYVNSNGHLRDRDDEPVWPSLGRRRRRHRGWISSDSWNFRAAAASEPESELE